MKTITVFHFTHQKAGSQWVREILKHSTPERFIPQEINNRQLTRFPIHVGKVYPAVYLPQNEFNRLFNPLHNIDKITNWYNFRICKNPIRSFTVIRDLRDTLVSLYFSRKFSHPLLTEEQSKLREYLNRVSQDEGLHHIIQTELDRIAHIQTSWTNSSQLLVRYEDLLEDAQQWFKRIIDHCEIGTTPEKLHAIVEYNTFQNATKRSPGEEDLNSHLRKGISGDWKNHFSKSVKDAFKARFGQVLVQTQYETSMDW